MVRNIASIIPNESVGVFDENMSPIDPMSHSRPPNTGSMLRRPKATLDKPRIMEETLESHYHLWIDNSQKESSFLRPVESHSSDAKTKIFNLAISYPVLASGVGSAVL